LEGLISGGSGIGHGGFDGDDDFSLSARKSLGNYGFGRLLFLLAFNGGEGFLFVRLSNFGVEVVSPGEVLFGRVLPGPGGASGGAGGASGGGEIPDVLLVHGGRLGDRGDGGGLVGRLAMWFVVGCSGELLAHFLEFGSGTRHLLFEFVDSGGVGRLGGHHGIFHTFEAGEELVDKLAVFASERDPKGRGLGSVRRRSSVEVLAGGGCYGGEGRAGTSITHGLSS
jgi:hypothetical protein